MKFCNHFLLLCSLSCFQTPLYFSLCTSNTSEVKRCNQQLIGYYEVQTFIVQFKRFCHYAST